MVGQVIHNFHSKENNTWYSYYVFNNTLTICEKGRVLATISEVEKDNEKAFNLFADVLFELRDIVCEKQRKGGF